MTSFASSDINEIVTYAEYYIPRLEEISKVAKSSTKKEEGEIGKDDYYQITYDITLGDNFESTVSYITLKYVL